jgi:subtilisin family serine protease
MSTWLLLLLSISFTLVSADGDDKRTYCADPVTSVYVLANGVNPRMFAMKYGLKYLGSVANLKDTYEFEIACADDYEGGHDLLIDALMTRISPLLLGSDDSNRRRNSNDADIKQVIGLQRKRQHSPRGWETDEWHLTAAPTGLVHTWTALATTGSNSVVISIVDDGVAWNNVDLRSHFSLALSANYNSGGVSRDDPTPSSRTYSHGTAAAGVAAASGSLGPPPNNAPGCAFGVAPTAALAGVRLISEPVTDATEASAISHGYENISVYSCSWGPADDGKRADGPGPLSRMAIANSAAYGRGGRGSLYVWAAGNGNLSGDSCAYDGYASLKDVIAVGAVARDGKVSDYSERCSSLFVTAPSSGRGYSITTTTVPHATLPNYPSCRSDFGGTSAAAPYVAGVVALIIDANPKLLARQVMEILADTATPIERSDPSWVRNSAGRLHSTKYGFGMVNASGAVALAKHTPAPANINDALMTMKEAWTECTDGRFPRAIPDNGCVDFRIQVTGEENTFEVRRAQATVYVAHRARGQVSFSLTSPSGTTGKVPARSVSDSEGRDLLGWTFDFLQMWGERSNGTWKLRVCDTVVGISGQLNRCSLQIYGV